MKTTRTVAIAFSAALLSTGPTTVNAGVPTLDYSNLTEAITSNISELKRWAEEKAKMAMEMDLEAMLTKMAITNLNNGYANMIARLTHSSQEIQNQEIAEQMAVDPDVCGNVASAIYTEQTDCYISDMAKQKAHQISTDSSRYDLGPAQQDAHRKAVTKKVLDTCTQLSTVDTTELTEDQAAMYSQCVQAGSLIGAGTDSTYTETEQKAAEMQIRLLTGPVPEAKNSNRMSKTSTGYVRTRLAEMRKDAFKSLAVGSLSEIASIRYSPGPSAPLSTLSEYENFIKDRKDPEWITRVGGATVKGEEESSSESGSEGSEGGAKKISYRTELLKKMTIIELKQTELQLEQFKHQLRLEGLNAAMLSIMTDPL